MARMKVAKVTAVCALIACAGLAFGVGFHFGQRYERSHEAWEVYVQGYDAGRASLGNTSLHRGATPDEHQQRRPERGNDS